MDKCKISKSLRWICNQIPDNLGDSNEERMLKCIKLYCQQGAETIEELENKIENGTLIELLFKAGDKVYQFDNGGEIYKNEIKSIYYANNTLIYDCGYFAFDERAIGESIFLTKAEAEKKLKELQNER